MEDILVLLLTAAVMIGGAISSANKKKKEAARKAGSGQPDNRKAGMPAKSLSEILEELGKEQSYSASEEEKYEEEAEPDYFEEEMATLAEQESAAERLEAMTFKPMTSDSVEWRAKKARDEEAFTAIDDISEPVEDNNILADFDLRRAVIESEILRPKHEQY